MAIDDNKKKGGKEAMSYGKATKPMGLSKSNGTPDVIKKKAIKTAPKNMSKPRELQGVTITAKGYKHIREQAPEKKSYAHVRQQATVPVKRTYDTVKVQAAPKKMYAKGMPMATVGGKPMSQSKIDSAIKATKGLSKYAGTPSKNVGGQREYRGSAAEALNLALKKKK